MQDLLLQYIPEKAVPKVMTLLDHDNLSLTVKRERKTRYGDYKRSSNGQHQITVNSNLNHYRFLVTLVHEIAHFEAFENYGRSIKPHGLEWKRTFQHLMLPFLNPDIFPLELLPLLAHHFKNPRASSDTDTRLAYALKQFDIPNNKKFIFEVPLHTIFETQNGRIFRRGEKQRTRYKCMELSTQSIYLFNANVEVDIVDLNNVD
jgi:hypothetical protein